MAAVTGAAWALKVAGAHATCRVTAINGMPCDTNPTLVAIAAARAVWTSLQFTPGKALIVEVEEAIMSSHRLPEGRLGLPPVPTLPGAA